MQLPVQAQSTIFAEPWEADAGRDELAAIAVACDKASFDYVGVCDHVAIPVAKSDAMGTAWFDTVATLGWLAGITGRVRLLSHVYVAALRHPLATAKTFATLDELSGGRVVLGVGAGHVADEFSVLGVDFAERGHLTDDAVDGIRTAWSDEFGWIDSTLGAFGQRPRPVQPGGPPIWVGGSSPAALLRAARRGDGWLPQGTTKADMPGAIAHIAEMRAAAGRTGAFTIGAIARPLFLGDPGGDWDLGRATLAGDADRIRAEIADYEALGVDNLQVRFRSRSMAEYVEQIERFAEQVMS
ncbi:MAG TPA: TIGR03619 family F420-dependent LLM class oxidoreductase [Acidimicrobiales bacterium]|nr:TIGR03619 family F420-dependent LLM class oxidoreductase [Acidimicrobiales bacterium]